MWYVQYIHVTTYFVSYGVHTYIHTVVCSRFWPISLNINNVCIVQMYWEKGGVGVLLCCLCMCECGMCIYMCEWVSVVWLWNSVSWVGCDFLCDLCVVENLVYRLHNKYNTGITIVHVHVHVLVCTVQYMYVHIPK